MLGNQLELWETQLAGMKLGAPLIMVAWGWHAVAQIWATVLAVTAIAFFLVIVALTLAITNEPASPFF